MSDKEPDVAESARRRRLRAALDDLAPDPLQLSDRTGLTEAPVGSKAEAETARGGLSEEALRRERPPHHGG